MNGGADEIVLVAGELRPLSGDAPPWPGGRSTVFLPADEPLPDDDRIVALIPLLSRTLGPEELDRLPSLRVVANYAVGHDNVDVRAAARRGVAVTNTPDVLTESTADLTWALILAAARRLREGLELAASGRWEGWRPDQLRGLALEDRTLGMLGAGRIGSATARRAPGFGMDVVYWSRSRNRRLEREVDARRAGSLAEALGASDVVSVHLPLTPETRGRLGPDELGRMPAGSVLVNTGRGELVDPGALADALDDGPLAAAGLDVYPEEPEIPGRLREHPRCFVLPHLGSATLRARRGMWELAAENVRRVLRGEEPATPVET
jgi:glyoxylate reductase